MKAKRGILILSILIGLIAAVGIYRIVERMDTTPEVTIEYRKVLVAINTIPENTVITADMVTLVDVPAEALHAEAVTTVEDAVGNMTTDLIVKDEQILKSRLVSNLPDDPQKLSYRIPENMRAISIPVNELNAVSGHIVKGDKIDILVTYTLPDFYPDYEDRGDDDDLEPGESSEEAEETSTEPEETSEPEASETEAEERTITTVYTQFQMLEVLYIGTPGFTGEGGSLASTMVLLVTPEQAEELVYVLNTGSITLLLRNPADDTVAELEFYNADVFRAEREME